MTKLDDRTTANVEVALEKACRVFPNGGDHESRKYIAQKLELSAKKGNVTLGGLDTIARSAVQELSKAKHGLAAISKRNDLIGLAVRACKDALEALNNALASGDLESAHEFIEQAKGHLLNAVNSRERAPKYALSTRSRKIKKERRRISAPKREWP